jgi:hypothetical protein
MPRNIEILLKNGALMPAAALVMLLFVCCFSVYAYSEESSISEKIAEAYGVKGFDKVEEIKFTFNVRKGETEARRSWIWRPKENLVTFSGGGTDKPVTYSRKEITADSPDSLREIDAHFINDQYWLLFPFHLVWDSGMKVELAGENVKFPMGKGSGRMVSVIYPPTGGYTPGDRYDLFLDDNDMIAEWIYRRGGSETPTVTASWDDNRRVGPITISLNHPGADGKFRVWFTDVEIKLSGSGEPIKAGQ